MRCRRRLKLSIKHVAILILAMATPVIDSKASRRKARVTTSSVNATRNATVATPLAQNATAAAVLTQNATVAAPHFEVIDSAKRAAASVGAVLHAVAAGDNNAAFHHFEEAKEALLNAPLILALFGVLLLLVWVSIQRRTSNGDSKVTVVRTEKEGEVDDIMRSLGSPNDGVPREEGSMVPSSGLVLGNSEEASPFDNEFCRGSFLTFHRATYDKHLDKSGEYRYGEYFLGKKRLWEARMQFSFKKMPLKASDLFFGIELEEYVPMNAATKGSMDILVEALKTAVGKQVYHTAGDDPKKVSGPLERPAFVMPFYAFDQFIVTPPGEPAPSLMDPDMPSMGSRRYQRVREYKKEIDELEFKTGYTYTFNFWGISRWLDRVKWEVIMPVIRSRINFNKFAGRPPVHVVIYTLKKDQVQAGDPRHLQFKKNYLLDVAFWSSVCRPPKEIILPLFRGVQRKSPEVLSREKTNGHRKNNKHDEYQPQGFFSCCVARPQHVAPKD